MNTGDTGFNADLYSIGIFYDTGTAFFYGGMVRRKNCR